MMSGAVLRTDHHLFCASASMSVNAAEELKFEVTYLTSPN